jgi:type IV pilus assembly protein PilQ
MRAVALFTAAVTAAAPAFASVPAGIRQLALRTAPHALPRLVSNPIARTRAVEARAAVTGVSVVAGGDAAAAVLIRVDRAVEVQDFVLDGPRRVVLDLSGATLAVAGNARYDGATRGGVVNVRLAQFRTGVVRVVVELDGKRAYRVERTDGAVRLVVQGESGATFAPWQAGAAVSVAAASAPVHESAPAEQHQAAPVEQPPQQQARREAASRREVTPNAAPRREVDHVAAREPEPAPRQVAVRAPAEAPAETRDGPRLTVTYQDADIRDVVAAFAAFSGRTIIVGKEVTGNITAEIKDQPWDVALRALLRSQGLALSEDFRNSIITVDSYKNLASNRATEPIATQILDINYAKADSLVPLVQTLLSRECAPGDLAGAAAAAGAANPNSSQQQSQQNSGVPRGCVVRGAVTADRSTNKLLISDVPSNMTEIVSRVRELDVRTPQVAIKAKIVFVNRTGLEDIGVSYDLGTGTQQFFQQLVQRIDPSTRKPVDTNGDGVPDGLGGGDAFSGDRVALGGNALSALANANAALQPSALNLIYSATLGRFQLTSFVNALQQSELADVQSEPSIVTLNNRPAEIFVGQQVPIRVIDASSGSSFGGNAPRATVRLEEAGIKLSVTPQVTNNRRIVLDVRAENSNAQLSSLDIGVVFNRQYAENRVLVGDGETAAIGGLTVTETSKIKTGIPFLVDLPFIGRLFGQTKTSETKRDLLILVTPHILDEGEPAPIPAPRR